MNIYWDYQNQQFVAGLTVPQVVSSIQMVLRDLQSVTLYIVQPSTSPSAYYELVDPPSGWSPAFGAKTTLDASELLVTTVWTRTATGTFTGTIDLDKMDLISAMADVDSLELTGEFTLVNAADNNQASTQFALTVLKDVFRAGDTDLASNAAGPNFKVYNGNVYWYEPLSEKWYPLVPTQVDGVIVFATGEGITI